MSTTSSPALRRAIHSYTARGRRNRDLPAGRSGSVRSPVSESGGTPAGCACWTYSCMGGGSLGFPAMQAEAIREANVRYHDLAATHYDSKWGISYGEVGRAQVLGKLNKALAGDERFGRGLEVGAGTGYFTLNLLQAGVLERAVATDISPGMLATLSASAEQLGVEVKTVRCEATEVPFPGDSFDLVFG